MLTMFYDAVVLFLRGKLFKNPAQVVMRGMIGVAIVAGIVTVLVFMGITFGCAAIIGCVIGGAIQPVLFKNLQFA